MSSILKHFKDSFVPFADDSTAISYCKDNNLLIEKSQMRKGRLYINPEKVINVIQLELL